MKLLAIDTSGHICSACVFETDRQAVLAQESRDIGRGHAEILMQLIENCLSKATVSYQDLGRIGVTIGPGSFTGMRVGMSVARGFGVALSIPAVGVSTLDACEATARARGHQGELVSLLDARRGELYCKISGQEPFAASCEKIVRAISSLKPSICGSGAPILNTACQKELPIIHSDATFEIGLIARLAAKIPEPETPPEPLYLRSADAKVQAGFELERV